MKNHLKTQSLTISAWSFVVENIIEDAYVCGVAWSIAEDMVTELTLHAAANNIYLLVLIFVFQMTLFLDSELESACAIR